MKAVAYNIKDFEKESLARANAKVHDLTLISNALSSSTIHYAIGKEVVIVSKDDRIDAALLEKLKDAGVQKIVTRSRSTDHIDLHHAADLQIQVANTPYADRTPKGIAEQTIRNLTMWGQGKCVGTACCCINDCNAIQIKATDEPLKQ